MSPPLDGGPRPRPARHDPALGDAGPSAAARRAATWLIAALPALVLVHERIAGLIGLAWLALCIWQRAALFAAAARMRPLSNPALLGFLAMAGATAVLCVLHPGDWRGIHNPSRFALLVPVALAIVALGVPARSYLTGIAIGGAYAGVVALVQVVALGQFDASGATNPNKFGFIATTFALIGMSTLGLPASQRPPAWLAVTGIGLALLAAALSGTRGAWGAFLVASFAWMLMRRARGAVRTRLFVAVFALGLLALAALEGKVVQRKFEEISSSLSDYRRGEGPIGARLEMWRAGLRMFVEHPLAGIGPLGFGRELAARIERGELAPALAAGRHGHPHNEYVNALATGGLIGLAGLAGALVAPLVYFLRRSDGDSHRDADGPDTIGSAMRVAGVVFVTAMGVFALSDAYFYIHYATIYYALTVVCLVGLRESARVAPAQPRAPAVAGLAQPPQA